MGVSHSPLFAFFSGEMAFFWQRECNEKWHFLGANSPFFPTTLAIFAKGMEFMRFFAKFSTKKSFNPKKIGKWSENG